MAIIEFIAKVLIGVVILGAGYLLVTKQLVLPLVGVAIALACCYAIGNVVVHAFDLFDLF